MIKDTYTGIGVMSGTSLDGLDIVCSEFQQRNGKWQYNIIKGDTKQFDATLLKNIVLAIKNPLSNHDELDLKLGNWIGQKIAEFIEEDNLEIDFIASHGQTIYHSPEDNLSIQVGNGSAIAEKTKLPVVNNFRIQDVNKGGQGAPLVPIGDLLLFQDYTYCLNLGGIANISIKTENGIKAFDVSICNIGLNRLAGKKGLPFDSEGKLGSAGHLIESLYNKWNELAYFNIEGPKSMDASFFEKSMWPYIDLSSMNVEDIIRSIYEHIAFQISKQIKHLEEEILITGGGAHNVFLTDLLKEKYSLKVVKPDVELIDGKEALIFAFMGLLKLRNEINVLSSVTGAEEDHVVGFVQMP